MTTVHLTYKEVGPAIGRLFKSFREAQHRGIVNAAMRGQSWIVSHLIPSIEPQPVDMGAFRAGWNFMPIEDGAVIYNPIPHAKFINFGVENPRVSARHLVEWVMRKRIANDERSARRAAWFIAQKINERGIFRDQQFRITKRAVDEFILRDVKAQVQAELAKVGWSK